MHMLTKRTHIMLDETTFQVLTNLARQKRASVGKLIRHAVAKIYLKPHHLHRAKVEQNYKNLLAWQQQIGTAKQIDYRQLIEDGRSR